MEIVFLKVVYLPAFAAYFGVEVSCSSEIILPTCVTWRVTLCMTGTFPVGIRSSTLSVVLKLPKVKQSKTFVC